jgi:hypothetical protein
MQQFYKFITWRFVSLNIFRRIHAHHQELTTALAASGSAMERGGSSVVSRGLAGYEESGWVSRNTFLLTHPDSS